MAATYSEAQFSAVFFAVNFYNFLGSFRELLATLPFDHPDAIQHDCLRMDSNLLEAWYISHRDNL